MNELPMYFVICIVVLCSFCFKFSFKFVLRYPILFEYFCYVYTYILLPTYYSLLNCSLFLTCMRAVHTSTKVQTYVKDLDHSSNNSIPKLVYLYIKGSFYFQSVSFLIRLYYISLQNFLFSLLLKTLKFF